MTFLKKVGTIVLRIVDAVANMNLLPLIEKAVPQPLVNAAEGAVSTFDRLRAAVNVIMTAEQMFKAANGPDAKTGSLKLKASTPYIAALIHSVMDELKPGQKPKDEAAFEAACTAATSALADAMNAYGD
jgi:hypothetical protein